MERADPVQGELNELLRSADKHDVAFSIASFSGTPVATIPPRLPRVTPSSHVLPPHMNPRGSRCHADRTSRHQPDRQYPLGIAGAMSVFIFTRLFSPHDYGVYLLGVGFASVIGVFLVGWFRNLILSGHARGDGTDVRGLVISGYLICCLTVPIAYVLGRLVGLDTTAALAAVVLSVAIGLFELTQDLVRARLMARSVMKATLVRAPPCLGLGVIVALASPTGFLLLLSSALAYLLAVLVQSRTPGAARSSGSTAPGSRPWQRPACP